MKTTKQSILGVVLALLCHIHGAWAQNCPPPENFLLIISEDVPPVAHLTWDIPSGSSITGFTLTYTVDVQPPVTVVLSGQTTSFEVVLPVEWVVFEANIVSMCGDEQSPDQTQRKENLIIIDLVLARSAGGAEALVCQPVCTQATHFGYSGAYISPNGNNQEPAISLDDLSEEMSSDLPFNWNTSSGTPLVVLLYRIDRFCACMATGGSDFGNGVLVESCKEFARDRKDLSEFNVFTCYTAAPPPRNAAPTAAATHDLRVWPNPFQQQVLIQGLSAFKSCEIQFFNATGQRVWSTVLPENKQAGEYTIQLPVLPPGFYGYQIRTNDNQQWSGRLIKQ
jgi:hypothetical protein